MSPVDQPIVLGLLGDLFGGLGVFAVPVVAIICWAVVEVARGGQREKTKREIAAYVAEGTITPDEGERLLKAGQKAEK